jgi:hypothetical protein
VAIWPWDAASASEHNSRRVKIGPSRRLRTLAARLLAALENETDVLARGLVFYAAAIGLEIKHPDCSGPGVSHSIADELGVL